ncbi:hypothetical protein PPS11_31596 [Pseudomonas putida S11]|nr:hypothetical protein PPS11_31596 [Pseudomonas putida S11]
MRFQRLGLGGGADFPWAALEQGVAQFGLEVADGHAHGRRHPLQGPCSGGKRTAVEHGEKQLDIVAGKVHGSLLSEDLTAADFCCQER